MKGDIMKISKVVKRVVPGIAGVCASKVTGMVLEPYKPRNLTSFGTGVWHVGVFGIQLAVGAEVFNSVKLELDDIEKSKLNIKVVVEEAK